MTGAAFTSTLLANTTTSLPHLLPPQLLSLLHTTQQLALSHGLPSWTPLLLLSLIVLAAFYVEFAVSPVRMTHAKETVAVVVGDEHGLQTVWASLTGNFRHSKVTYERDILSLPDGGIISMDWCPSLDLSDKSTPIVVILHGLTGGSHESYVQDLVHEIVHVGKLRAVVCNFRGCAETELKTSQLYSGAWTEDIRHATAFIKRHFPDVPQIGIGFSLGANIMTKFVGEDGVKSPFIACVPVANPFDLLQGSHALHSSWIGREIYSYKMTQGLINMFQRHQHMLHTGPQSPFDPHEVATAKSLTEFDDAVTRRAFGFRTVHEYYRMGSSAQYVPDIRIPTLFLSALDDPIASYKTLPVFEAKANPNIIIATTARGGHIGWYEGLVPTRWFQRPVVEFVKAMFEAYLSIPPASRHLFLEAAHNVHPHPLPTPAHESHYRLFMRGSVHNPATHKTTTANFAAHVSTSTDNEGREHKGTEVVWEVKEQVVQTDETAVPTATAAVAAEESKVNGTTPALDIAPRDAEAKAAWIARLLTFLRGTAAPGTLMAHPHAKAVRRAVGVGLSIALGYWAGRRRGRRTRF
ncbi:hypothetical protein HDU96_007038 [Phlyctochytrium bullatum]|nr:hypothetical protein HDU96_007038 [Phlyctochytrium bullatum]